jgi:adenylate cyclase
MSRWGLAPCSIMRVNPRDSSQLEIERTYLLDRLPVLPADAVALRIEQGYFPARAGSLEGRLRRTTAPDESVACTHTIKRGNGLVRQEIEREITPDEFALLWPETEGRRLRKTRHVVTVGELKWEIDEYDELDLVLADIELPSPDAHVAPPHWLRPHIVRDVTDEPAYRNYRLALRVSAESKDRKG